MILVDANLLIYAVDSSAPSHDKARAWLEQTLSGSTRVALAWTVVLAFLRITTRAGILRNPLTPEQALAFVEGWFQQPYVEPLSPGARHWSILRQLIEAAGTAGNLTSDAHLATLALEHDCILASADNDFKRFPDLQHINPLR